jgi:hypothetical protein
MRTLLVSGIYVNILLFSELQTLIESSTQRALQS